MKKYFCWRCDRNMPFLEEAEWLRIEPHLMQGIIDIKAHRARTGCDIQMARNRVRSRAMSLFHEMTGVDGVHADVIHHHRLSQWGPECSGCGTLLRSPAAKRCVHCWRKRDVT